VVGHGAAGCSALFLLRAVRRNNVPFEILDNSNLSSVIVDNRARPSGLLVKPIGAVRSTRYRAGGGGVYVGGSSYNQPPAAVAICRKFGRFEKFCVMLYTG
jgi:hypothetical protein